MVVEPGWIAVLTPIIVLVVGLNIYFVRSEIAKNRASNEEVKAELKPNHGSSFADAVSAQFREIRDDIATLGESQARAEERHSQNHSAILLVGGEVANLKNTFTNYLIATVGDLREKAKEKEDGSDQGT